MNESAIEFRDGGVEKPQHAAFAENC